MGGREVVGDFWHCCCPPTNCRPHCRIHRFSNTPPIPRPPGDHSCVGRNLLAMGGDNTKIRPHTPVLPTDHSCVGRNLFLRKQESHNPLPPTAASLRRRMPHMFKIDSCLRRNGPWGERECVGVFWGNCGRQCGREGLSPLEIPAYAGMVCGGVIPPHQKR